MFIYLLRLEPQRRARTALRIAVIPWRSWCCRRFVNQPGGPEDLRSEHFSKAMLHLLRWARGNAGRVLQYVSKKLHQNWAATLPRSTRDRKGERKFQNRSRSWTFNFYWGNVFQVFEGILQTSWSLSSWPTGRLIMTVPELNLWPSRARPSDSWTPLELISEIHVAQPKTPS